MLAKNLRVNHFSGLVEILNLLTLTSFTSALYNLHETSGVKSVFKARCVVDARMLANKLRSSRAASFNETAEARLPLYSECVQCEGDDVILADEHRHFDELPRVEVCGEHRPGVIGDAGVEV